MKNKNKATKFAAEQTKKYTPEELIYEEVNQTVDYAFLLACKLNAEELTLERWLFDYHNTVKAKPRYERNEKGFMEMVNDDPATSAMKYCYEKKVSKRIAYAPTSNGTDNLLLLIDWVNKYKSTELARVLDRAIALAVEKKRDNVVYFKRDDKQAISYSKKVMDTDFDKISKAYLSLPEQLIHKDSLIHFIESFENLDSLKDGGYACAKKLFLDFKDKLTPTDLKKMSVFVRSRLERIEQRFLNFVNNSDLQTAKKMLKKEWSRQDADEVGKLFTKIENDYSLEAYKNLRAKYTREINRYLEVLRPLNKNIDGKPKYEAVSEMIADCKSTADIIEDSKYKVAAKTNNNILEEMQTRFNNYDYEFFH